VRAGRNGRINARPEAVSVTEITEVVVDPAPESETSAAAWSAVHGWQESARRQRSAPTAAASSGDEPAPEPKARSVAAATPITTVRASTTPRKPAARGKRTKRTH
jgi:precorrin-4/cobalt-precorrin-4 C11-methyltransferase